MSCGWHHDKEAATCIFFKRRRGEGVRIYHPLKLTSAACMCLRTGARSASCDRRQCEPVRVGKLQGRQANVTVSPSVLLPVASTLFRIQALLCLFCC